MPSQYEKRKAKTNENTSYSDVEESRPLDKLAFDIIYDETVKKYIKVTVEYNLTSGKARVKETKPIADSQPVAIYKMGEIMNRKVLGLKY